MQRAHCMLNGTYNIYIEEGTGRKVAKAGARPRQALPPVPRREGGMQSTGTHHCFISS